MQTKLNKARRAGDAAKASRDRSANSEKDANLALATQYVTRINRIVRRQVDGWIEMGRLVDEYAIKVEKEYGKRGKDAFKDLAEHPDAIYRASQLRNYQACYRLWLEFGGASGAPKVSMTHYVVILSANMNLDGKMRQLRQVEKESLSVAQLKKNVRENRASTAPISIKQQRGCSVPTAWKSEVDALTAQLSRAFAAFCKVNQGRGQQTVPQHLQEQLINISNYAVAHGYVRIEDIELATDWEAA